MAESGLTQPPAWAVISGQDDRTDTPFVNQIMLGAVTCGGASPVADGWLMLAGVGDAGMLWRDSVELDELRFPILVHSQELLIDTEGVCLRYHPSTKIVHHEFRRGVGLPVVAGEAHDASDRTEDLLLGDRHPRRHIGEHGRRDPVATLKPFVARELALDDQPSALVQTAL